MKRIVSLGIILALLSGQISFAQGLPLVSSLMSGQSNIAVAQGGNSVLLRAISFDDDGNLLNFSLDGGGSDSADELLAYFKVGLVLPNSLFWVNLRPDAPDQIIDPLLEKTDLGRILLEADVQLKKDISRFTDPSTVEGRKYWNKLYSKAERLFPDQDIEIPTIARPWIIPGEIVIGVNESNAYVYKALLDVKLEQDWVKGVGSGELGVGSEESKNSDKIKELYSYSAQLLREIVLPKLVKEVNSAHRYAKFRQVYYSLVLAQWFKARNGVTAAESFADSGDLSGLISQKPWCKSASYQAYLDSIRNGEYNKEETVVSSRGAVLRQYVSGGVVMSSAGVVEVPLKYNESVLNDLVTIDVWRDGGTVAEKKIDTVLRGNDLDYAIKLVTRDLTPEKDHYEIYQQLVETGSYVFNSYEGYLNERGLYIKRYFDEISQRLATGGRWRNSDFDALRININQIPRLSDSTVDLHLELFDEVLKGMSRMQMLAFSDVGIPEDESAYRRDFTLNLTPWCSNRCLICGLRGPDHVRPGQQMPYPMAIKILMKLQPYLHSFVPNYASDSLDYEDKIVGADITDIVRTAQAIGYTDMRIITHGSNSRKELAGDITRELNGMIKPTISVHVYHDDVKNYALKVLEAGNAHNAPVQAQLVEERNKLVDKYSARFTELVGAVGPGFKGQVRVFRSNPILMGILDPGRYEKTVLEVLGRRPRELTADEKQSLRRAYNVIDTMQSVQDEVWGKVKENVVVDKDAISNYRVLWVGKAVKFLKSLGVPDDVIDLIQLAEHQKVNLSTSVFDPIIEADGSLSVMIAEDKTRIIRPVSQIFTDPLSREFKHFVNYINLSRLLRNSINGPVMEDKQFKQVALERLQAYIEKNGQDASGLTLEDIIVYGQKTRYIQSLLSLEYRKALELLDELKPYEQPDDRLAIKIYEAIKDMPFPITEKFYVKSRRSLNSRQNIELMFEFDYYFAGEKRFDRDIERPYNKLVLKEFRAFSKKDVNNPRGETDPAVVYPQRLNLDQTRQRMLDSVLEFDKTYSASVDRMREAVEYLKNGKLDAAVKIWNDVVKDIETKRLAVQSLPAFQGLAEPQIRSELDSFLSAIAGKFNVDKIILVLSKYGGYDFSYSYGLSREELENYYLNRNAIYLQKMAWDAIGIRSVIEGEYTKIKHEPVIVFIGRSVQKNKVYGDLSENDKSALNELLASYDVEGGVAPWVKARSFLEVNKYVDFDFFMRDLRHNSKLDVNKYAFSDYVRTVDHNIEEITSGEMAIAELLSLFGNVINALTESSAGMHDSLDPFIKILKYGKNNNLTDITNKFCSKLFNYNRALSNSGVVFDVNIDNQPALVYCDINVLEIVVDNLIGNAVKYTPKGTISISMNKAKHEFENNKGVFKDSVVIEVADTGIGIPADELANVFKPGYRAGNVGGVEGTGIGLDIVKTSVAQMNGDVEIESEVGKGTKVRIYLPLAELPSEEQEQAMAKTTASAKADEEALGPQSPKDGGLSNHSDLGGIDLRQTGSRSTENSSSRKRGEPVPFAH